MAKRDLFAGVWDGFDQAFERMDEAFATMDAMIDGDDAPDARMTTPVETKTTTTTTEEETKPDGTRVVRTTKTTTIRVTIDRVSRGAGSATKS
jgi:hypothetical protein